MISANPVVDGAQTLLGSIVLVIEKGKSHLKFCYFFCQKSSVVKSKVFPDKCLYYEELENLKLKG